MHIKLYNFIILDLNKCGDGIVKKSFIEECDDGGHINLDGCNEGCLSEPSTSCQNNPLTCFSTVWGDGMKTSGKVWDDGNLNNGDGWSSYCTIEKGWSWMNGNSTSKLYSLINNSFFSSTWYL